MASSSSNDWISGCRFALFSPSGSDIKFGNVWIALKKDPTVSITSLNTVDGLLYLVEVEACVVEYSDGSKRYVVFSGSTYS